MTSPYRNERASLLERRAILRQELREVETRLKAATGRRGYEPVVAAVLVVAAMLAAFGVYLSSSYTSRAPRFDPVRPASEPPYFTPTVRDYDTIRKQLEDQQQQMRESGCRLPLPDAPASAKPHPCPPGDPLCVD